MSKITPAHLARAAFVYIRQSTAYQVVNNLESQRRQYGLVERARQLGWEDVQLVENDLGRSGGGTVRRGFEKLLSPICEEPVGAVASLEASRLARNGRDWPTLRKTRGRMEGNRPHCTTCCRIRYTLALTPMVGGRHELRSRTGASGSRATHSGAIGGTGRF
ncbi:recombinase family protein [Bradyrhizobium sp. 137]|nr:recombinase family protein [Bradyrhizobium sp. 137]